MRLALASKWAGIAGCMGLLLLPLSPMGCGGPGQGKVSGRVLYNGVALPGGRVTFRPADPKQNSVSAELDAEGNYQAVLPVGDVKICVDNRELEPPVPLVVGLPPGLPPDVKKALSAAKAAPPPAPKAPDADRPSGRYVPIPEKYYTLETSGLQFKVQGGEQKHDIELTK